MRGSASEGRRRQAIAVRGRRHGPAAVAAPVRPRHFRHVGGFSLLLACALLLSARGASGEPLQDPTRPPGWTATGAVAVPAAAAVEAPVFAVSMLKLSPSLRLAVVNGRSVREGDTVDGATVVAIAADGVTLDFQGRRLKADAPGGEKPLGGMKTKVQ